MQVCAHGDVVVPPGHTELNWPEDIKSMLSLFNWLNFNMEITLIDCSLGAMYTSYQANNKGRPPTVDEINIFQFFCETIFYLLLPAFYWLYFSSLRWGAMCISKAPTAP